MSIHQVFGAILIHLIFLASVFDIYFKSPVVNVSNVHKPEFVAPPARRLVLIVADGLRADTFYQINEENDQSNAPFLRQIIDNHGVFGVCHTRVPTESRPGHVALIAGMYEDPSAITRGWRENPVDFDSIFNQSRETWAWGSPDILPIFGKGDSRYHMEMYLPEEEDFFGTKDLHKLDEWVFEKVEAFFKEAHESVERQMRLRKDKLILFLHLLGLDSNGHANKPNSDEYKRNIRIVDAGVKKVSEIVEKYWRNDDRTAFIFTADHGMTDWGSHGTGMDHETQVPIVAWGAGLRYPEKSTRDSLKSKDLWRLNHLRRSDVSQADIAPLASVLLGVGVPKNSVGKLPHDFLRMQPAEKVEASLTVAKQMFSMFKSMQNEFYKYPLHSPFPNLNEKSFEEKVSQIKSHTRVGKFEKAIELSENLFEISLEGVEYYRTYHRNTLFVLITVSYIGFIVLTGVTISKNFTPSMQVMPRDKTRQKLDITAAILIALAVCIYSLQKVPYHFLVYYLMPIIVWRTLIMEILTYKPLISSKKNLLSLISYFMVIFLVIELNVWTFFNRKYLSASTTIVTIMVIAIVNKSAPRKLKLIFFLLNIVLCAFTFQPSVGKERNNFLVISGSALSTIVSMSFDTSLKKKPFLLFNLFSSGIIVWISSSFQLNSLAKTGIQCLAWFIFVAGIPTVFGSRERIILHRLHLMTLALQASYILLSLTYEGLFLLTLAMTLFTWVKLESREDRYLEFGKERKVVSVPDIFRSLMFLHFSLVSFFGTGNIASLNSFDPRSIQCLVSVFSPFLMGGLLLSKVLIPFLMVSMFVCAVKYTTQMPSRPMFLMVMLFSDIMGLHFYFLVTDKGSWQEIGTSLSHYVIVEGMVIFLQVFFFVAEKFLGLSSNFSSRDSVLNSKA